MTMPDERSRAVVRTRKFLLSLTDAKETPRVPKRLREQALSILKHYPTRADMEIAAAACPLWFGRP
ncbi:BPSL0761 family protein [Variovorax guangxiensis]|uniref:Uncharacterized protein n=1 Tax=Variovorax guangxiensis TaxID=1775474 RepID=A0A502DY73_9BURK|nr:hypothetical protein EAH83_11070 [Variovorax ginsengisoli]TPG29216.1 hypothetical protein EAH82_10730 [Variovorax guangxiensis]